MQGQHYFPVPPTGRFQNLVPTGQQAPEVTASDHQPKQTVLSAVEPECTSDINISHIDLMITETDSLKLCDDAMEIQTLNFDV